TATSVRPLRVRRKRLRPHAAEYGENLPPPQDPTCGPPPRSDHQRLTEPCCRTLSLPQRGREVIEANLHCSEMRRRRRCVARPKRLISLARLIDLIDLLYLGEPAF